jgi:hypothetical protein
MSLLWALFTFQYPNLLSDIRPILRSENLQEPRPIEMRRADNENESEAKCNDEIQHGLPTENQYVAQVHSLYEPFNDRDSFHIPT